MTDSGEFAQKIMPAEIVESRLIGIDSFRYLLCFAVATLHALPGDAGKTTAIWATLIACGCRGAVPFFFIASGYFMRVPKSWNRKILLRPIARLLPVYAAWFLIYALIFSVETGQAQGLDARSFFTGGTAYHLWFIPVLGLALSAVPTAIIAIGARSTAFVVAAIAVFGLMFGAYRDVLHLHAFSGIRLTMAPALVFIGYWIAQSGFRCSLARAVFGVALACVFVIAEEALIARLSGSNFTSHDIVLTTYLLGTAIFLLALSLEAAAGLAALAWCGRVSLGVYASHLFFVQMLVPWIGQDSLVRASALAIASTVLATLLSIVVSGLPFARRLVR